MKYYCPICGNKLDPKIHYKPKKLGKVSSEVANLQKELLILLIKTFYIEDKTTGKKVYFESLTNMYKEKK